MFILVWIVYNKYSAMKNGYDFPFQQNIIREIQPSYRHETLGLSLNHQVVDRAMGCLFGSFIGDALGAYLEFAKEKDFSKMMQDVMDMPGGGVFALKPGQVTDDSQLAFHLLDQLAKFKFGGDFKQEEASLTLSIARGYLSWYESRPFDIGITCRKGLEVIRKEFQSEPVLLEQKDYNKLSRNYTEYVLGEIHSKIKITSEDSQSNGSLMRITPIPFFFSIFSDRKPEKDVINKQLGITKDLMKKFIHDEVKLLHPNSVLVDVGYVWAKMLRALIRRENNKDIKIMYGHFVKEFEDNRIGWGKLSDNSIDARKNIGWAKIAVALGLESLGAIANKVSNNEHTELNQVLFTKELKYVLSKGGDTDTNAAIVGGMLGSIVGFKNLPKKYLKTLMNLRHQQKDQPARRQNRPTFYQPRHAFANAYRLLHKRLLQK